MSRKNLKPGILVYYAEPAGSDEVKHLALFRKWYEAGCWPTLIKLMWRQAQQRGVTQLTATQWCALVARWFPAEVPARITRRRAHMARNFACAMQAATP